MVAEGDLSVMAVLVLSERMSEDVKESETGRAEPHWASAFVLRFSIHIDSSTSTYILGFQNFCLVASALLFSGVF